MINFNKYDRLHIPYMLAPLTNTSFLSPLDLGFKVSSVYRVKGAIYTHKGRKRNCSFFYPRKIKYDFSPFVIYKKIKLRN